MGHFICFLKRKMGRCAPAPRQSQLHYSLSSASWTLQSPSFAKAPGEKKNCYPRASNSGRPRHMCSSTGPSGLTGICFTKLEMAGKSLFGETNPPNSVKVFGMTEWQSRLSLYIITGVQYAGWRQNAIYVLYNWSEQQFKINHVRM
jgi:hypothetical protein